MSSCKSDEVDKYEAVTEVKITGEMNEQLLSIDIEPNSSSSTEGKSEKPRWTFSDNSFRFNFLQESCIDVQNQASNKPKLTNSQFSITPGSTFSFNFQIHPVEDMATTESSDATFSSNQQCSEVENPSLQQGSSQQGITGSSKSKKKKKKTVKSKAADGDKQQEPSGSTADKQKFEDTELSTEEQLQRQLDWCIEQLEFGMRSQKATPKQKEEASRALKTLRSSKAPLVKKRQVMRAMAGDYRKKMEEEKSKQFKLIQNETASAQLRAVSEFPKKSVFHRRATIKSQTPESHTNSNNSQVIVAAQPERNLVFTSSKEEFCFNFF